MRSSLFVLLASILTTTAWAATDPDIDPAMPLSIDAVAEGLTLEITSAEAFLQHSVDGVSYVRIDLEMVNTGSEPIHAHEWHVAFEGKTAWSVTAGTVEPGETRNFSQLILGRHVELVAGSLDSVAVTASIGNSILCAGQPTQADCEQWAAQTRSFCWGSCVLSGAAGGDVSCMESTYVDANGLKCSVWTPVCLCTGRLTVTDGLASGLIDPSHPQTQEIAANPPLLEMQQLALP